MDFIIGQEIFVFLCDEDLSYYGKDHPNNYTGMFVGMRGDSVMVENNNGDVNCYEPESIFGLDEEDQNIYVIHEFDGGVHQTIINTNKIIESRHMPYQVVKMAEIDFDEDTETVHILFGENSSHVHF